MLLDLRLITDEGLLLEGEESPAVIELGDDDSVRPASPLRYRLLARFDGSDLLLEGSLEASFDLRCVRCLETFRKTVRLAHYVLVEEVEKGAEVDLTDRLREDILLDLPDYPKCEQADSPRECPALAQISPDSDYKAISASQNDPDVWKALDDLKPGEGNDS